MKILKRLLLGLQILALVEFVSGEPLLWQQTLNLSSEQRREMVQYARSVLVETLRAQARSDDFSRHLPRVTTKVVTTNHLQAGLFVTLVRKGKVRGCYGSLTPEGADVFSRIREYTVAAATSDFRNPPIHESELNEIVIILSLIGPIEPISQIQEVDPKVEGLLVRSGDRAAVLLPGEARSASWQVSEARRQAGIGIQEPAELFKIHTLTVYER